MNPRTPRTPSSGPELSYSASVFDIRFTLPLLTVGQVINVSRGIHIEGKQSMGIKMKTTLTLVGHSLRCVIPKLVCEALGLKEGDVLTV